MSDLFETDELAAYWADKPVKSYVVTLGYYPRGCWVTGRKVTKPSQEDTFYVKARDEAGAIRAAKRHASTFRAWPSNAETSGKVLCDRIRYMGPDDFPPAPQPWHVSGPHLEGGGDE